MTPDPPRAMRGGEPAADRRSLALGIAIPLGVGVATYGLIQVAGADGAWIFWIPVWLSAPVLGGFAWRSLSDRATAIAATVVAFGFSSGVALVVGQFSWLVAAPKSCADGPDRPAFELYVPALIIGLLVGVGTVACGLTTMALVRRDRPVTGIVLGGGGQLVIGLLATLLWFVLVLILGPRCAGPYP